MVQRNTPEGQVAMLFVIIGSRAGKSRDEVVAIFPRHKAFLEPLHRRPVSHVSIRSAERGFRLLTPKSQCPAKIQPCEAGLVAYNAFPCPAVANSNVAKIRVSLNTPCPYCGHSIRPADRRG